jgi:ABC-2 type transport system permease protein
MEVDRRPGRYLRLYLCFLRFSFSRAMEFRLDFFFRIGMDSIWYAVNLAFFWLLYRHVPFLGGWDFDQALVFVAGVFVADAVHMTVFSNNAWWFPIFVNRGDLDYYLVRPVSSLFFLSLRDFAANSFLNLLIALGVLVWTLVRYPHPLAASDLGFYALLLGVGIFVNWATQMIFLIPVFWLHNASGLRDTWFALERYASRPDGIYRGWLRRVLTSVLPFAVIVSFPTRVLWGEDVVPIALHMGAVALGATIVLLLLWRAGLRAYASASS